MANDGMGTLDSFFAAFDEAQEKAKQSVFSAARDNFYHMIENSSLSEDRKALYLAGIDIKMVGNSTILIEIKAGSETLKGVEEGTGPYSIKDKMLNNGRGVKTSKAGNRYKVIPIGKDEKKGAALSNSSAGEQNVQEQIQKVLASIKPILKFASTNKQSGSYTRVESFKEAGLVRSQTFSSKSAFDSKRPSVKTGFVLFRVMSDKPGTSDWIHPGLKGQKMFEKAEEWATKHGADIFEAAFNQLMKDFI